MSFDLTCPYCDKEVRPCEDSRDQCMNIEKECPHCEKTFLYQIEYEPTYTAWEVPCLNGGEHDYRQICGAPAYYFKNRKRCHNCGKEITTPESDAADRQARRPYEKEVDVVLPAIQGEGKE